MNWHPLLTGRLADSARAAVTAIADDLQRSPIPTDSSLARGLAGLAVFYAYAARAGLADPRVADDYMERAVVIMESRRHAPTLYSGFVGVAWAVEHLWSGPSAILADLIGDEPTYDKASSGGIGQATNHETDDDPGAEIDEILLNLASTTPWNTTYDLLYGLVGLGVYALERGTRSLASPLLDQLVTRLEELLEPTAAGMTLPTPVELLLPRWHSEFPDGYYNLGVAHGIPGVLALLGSVPGPRASALRNTLGAWLCAVLCRGPDGSLYPTYLDRRNPTPRNPGSRAAWCYGDPGIAAALLRGARASRSSSLEEHALEVARAAASRPIAGSGVFDAGLCHGSAGLLHLFNRLHQATGEPAFAEAALRWASHTLSLRGEGIGGFRRLVDYVPARWEPSPSFLDGSAGIGLALLAAISDIEPRWDIVLLSDIPPLTR